MLLRSKTVRPADGNREAGWRFEQASIEDIDELMSWFPDAHSVHIWGGPIFRYPFNRRTFHKDCRWKDFESYCLRNPAGEFAAFGQLTSRYERSHLARLVTHPDMRGQGVGKKLILGLIGIIDCRHATTECGLFVFKDNEPALACYRSLGFKIHEFPDAAPMREQCFYMTRLN